MWARCRVYFTQEEDVTWSLRKLGPLGSGFGGSAVLILPQDSHAFIIYSFIQQKFLELSLGTRFCVELW